MRTRGATWTIFMAAAVVGFGLACVVELPPDGRYTCASDPDCGGDGYVCTPATGGPRYCCIRTGAETCNGQDDDCSGVVDDITPASCYTGPPGTENVGRCHGGTEACSDGGVVCAGQVVPMAEACNQIDDNCNGPVDEGFDLLNDPVNCGRCGVGCSNPYRCQDGGCAIPVELTCDDGQDNDGDLAIDCADADCATRSCGAGCTCINYQRVEMLCGDTLDNDLDTFTDCADSNCDGGSCGNGCQCVGTDKVELLCNDTVDNDLDTSTDCEDSNCDGGSCGNGCACLWGRKAEIRCDDTADNDGDSLVNCLDSDCEGGSCGLGCICGGGLRIETTCNDVSDNDGDTAVDCADSDCDGGSCGNGCQCAGGQKTETDCLNTTGDEDGDGLSNCDDPNCLGRLCRVNGSRICVSIGNCQ